jgi:ABC-type transporter Mla MlaB component
LRTRGNLDLSIAFWLFGACTYVDERLQTCVIDITRVSRVFDSGVALILVMLKRMQKYQVELVIVGDNPALHLPDLETDDITHLRNSFPKAVRLAPARESRCHTVAGKICHCSGSVSCCSDSDHSCGHLPRSKLTQLLHTNKV